MNNLFKGDHARVTEWVGLYLEEAPGYFKRVQDGLSSGDMKALASAVHELRPQAHYLGAPKLLELLVLIGEKAGREETDGCTAPVEELMDMGRRIDLELREHARRT